MEEEFILSKIRGRHQSVFPPSDGGTNTIWKAPDAADRGSAPDVRYAMAMSGFPPSATRDGGTIDNSKEKGSMSGFPPSKIINGDGAANLRKGLMSSGFPPSASAGGHR